MLLHKYVDYLGEMLIFGLTIGIRLELAFIRRMIMRRDAFLLP